MTPETFRAIREKLGFSPEDWATAIGYRGKNTTRRVMVARLESGLRPVPVVTSLLVQMFERHGVPDDFRVTWEACGVPDRMAEMMSRFGVRAVTIPKRRTGRRGQRAPRAR